MLCAVRFVPSPLPLLARPPYANNGQHASAAPAVARRPLAVLSGDARHGRRELDLQVRPVLAVQHCAVLPVFAVPVPVPVPVPFRGRRVRCRLGSRVAIYMTNSDRHYFTCSEGQSQLCSAAEGSSPQSHAEALTAAVQVRRAA